MISGLLSTGIHSAFQSNQDKNSTHFELPLDFSAIYASMLGFLYVVAGLLHFNEILCLFHFLWFILGLPSGYLFLMIYSACNINNRSWGTREAAFPTSISKSDSWLDYFLGKWYRFLEIVQKCVRKKPQPKADDTNHAQGMMREHNVNELIPYIELDEDVMEWLHNIKCDVSILYVYTTALCPLKI